MPATYVNIASITTVATQTSTITLSSIPQTYTDLMLLCSIRGDRQVNADPTNITLNGSAGGTDYSCTRLFASQSSPSATRSNNDSRILTPDIVPQNFMTGNVFCNFSIYLPNYTTSGTKSLCLQGGFTRSSGATANTTSLSGLVRTSSPVTSIVLSGNGYNAGSTFYLYGIKNS